MFAINEPIHALLCAKKVDETRINDTQSRPLVLGQFMLIQLLSYTMYLVAISPILIYPALLIAGFMFFDAPGSSGNWQAWAGLLLSAGYPIFIIVCIRLSMRYESILLALVAAIPAFILFYVFFLQQSLRIKQEYHSETSDYVYDGRAFLHIDEPQDGYARIILFEHRGPLWYEKHTIADIYENRAVQPEAINIERIRMITYDRLRGSLDSNGNSVFDNYCEVPPDEDVQLACR